MYDNVPTQLHIGPRMLYLKVLQELVPSLALLDSFFLSSHRQRILSRKLPSNSQRKKKALSTDKKGLEASVYPGKIS
jgi:hypothetical protein